MPLWEFAQSTIDRARVGDGMKIIKAIILSVIGVLVIALGKVELRHLMHEGFWPGLAGVLMCLGVIVVIAAIRRRARQNARASSSAQVGGAPGRIRRPHVSGEVGRLLAAYPGPITLKPSRTKWWIVTALGIVMTAACVFVGVVAFVALRAGQHDAGIGIAMAVFGVCFFGLGVALPVRQLLFGALQLDDRGFQATFFRRREYLWTEVSDFQPYRRGSASGVRFDAAHPRSRLMGQMNNWFGYPNDALADTYGLTPEGLANLMQVWQSAALEDQDNEQPLAPVPEQSEGASDDQALRANYAACP